MKPIFQRIRSIIGTDRESLLIAMVMSAAIASVVYYSRERATDNMNYFILCVLGIAAVGYCVVGSAAATKAWFERRPIRMIGWVAVVMVAMLWEANAHLGVGSANQDALTATRTANFEAREDTKEAVNRAAGKLRTLKEEAAWGAKEPLEAVQAKIEAKEAHKFYRINTEQCTVMKGRETTQFCQEYRELQAAKALAMRKVTLAEEVKAAERELETARAAAKGVKTTMTAERADTRNIRKVVAAMGVTDYDADLGQAALLVLAMLAFLSIAEILRTAREFDDKPKVPWAIFSFLRKCVHFLTHGEWKEPPRINNSTHVTYVDGKPEELLRLLASRGVAA